VGLILGKRSNAYMGSYAASKAALDSLTRTMAMEFAPNQTQVNVIARGVIPVKQTAVPFQDLVQWGAGRNEEPSNESEWLRR
jgi:NAD(P)-dependent dehydrogenase (short-subunit alcohol dehydrogenase family)